VDGLDALLRDAVNVSVSSDDAEEFEKLCDSARAVADAEAEEQSPDMKRLEELAVTGVFDIRDRVGQTWSRTLKRDQDVAKACRACMTRESKTAFRESWAKTEFAKVLEQNNGRRSRTAPWTRRVART